MRNFDGCIVTGCHFLMAGNSRTNELEEVKRGIKVVRWEVLPI